MVRNFRGQVKISEVQEEFDKLISKLNTSIEEYNNNVDITADLDYSKGSASLGSSGYCLTVGGLKTILNNYAGTMMGGKPFKVGNNKTFVTAGVYIDSTGCKTTRGQLVNQIGRHLYFDPSSNSFSISNDASSPSIDGYMAQPSIPTQDNNDGTYYVFDDFFSNPTQSYMIFGESINDGYSVVLSKFGSSRSEECNSMRIHVNLAEGTQHYYLQEVADENTTCRLHVYIPDVRTMSSYSSEKLVVDIRTSGNNGYVLSVPISNIQNIENYSGVGSTCAISQYGNERGRLLVFSLQSASEITTEINYIDFDVSISAPTGSSTGDAMSETVSVTIFNFNISRLYVYGSIAPTGICDMNPNRSYPYIKTFHKAELNNLRTNKITTESRNLSNGATSSVNKIVKDTYSDQDNKDKSIFVSFNARGSNAGQPNIDTTRMTIDGVVSNFALGARYSHGSSTSVCYRFPKFFFLPKGVATPFSSQNFNTNNIWYHKYKAQITQKK